jgi:hypothetical protein
MIEGLWTVEFKGPTGVGGGVVVLTKNQVLGGDSGFAYNGTYEFKAPDFKAAVSVRQFNASFQNVFGVRGNFDLVLNAKLQGSDIVGTGALASAPTAKISVHLKKQADLK